MKFWPQDYEGDPALKACSLAAQGLWMRMLCAMHRSEPYGHLAINGAPPTVKQVAQIAGTTTQTAQKLLSELQSAGVFSITTSGVPFSRRMVADAEKTAQFQEFGKKGGNPTLKATDKGGVNPTVKGGVILQEAESESDTDRVIHFVHNSRARKQRATRPEPKGFEEFWRYYPAKVGKAAARKAWPKAVQQAGSPEELVIALKARLHLFPDEAQYIPNPSTWLNQGRWEDDPETLFARNQRSA